MRAALRIDNEHEDDDEDDSNTLFGTNLNVVSHKPDLRLKNSRPDQKRNCLFSRKDAKAPR